MSETTDPTEEPLKVTIDGGDEADPHVVYRGTYRAVADHEPDAFQIRGELAVQEARRLLDANNLAEYVSGWRSTDREHIVVLLRGVHRRNAETVSRLLAAIPHSVKTWAD